MKTICFLAGARPNYMKIFPIWKEMDSRYPKVKKVLVHTGQHYDELMSGIFFREFSMPAPDFFLGVGSGPHSAQTAKVMVGLEELFLSKRPDILVVVGDVNSTLAGALVAAKMEIKLVHVESGLRSFDRAMPEEINRIVTDTLSDHLLTSCREADDQLVREGISSERIHFVGNVMIDSLSALLPQAKNLPLESMGSWARGKSILVTLHRPSNVDVPKRLDLIVKSLCEVAQEVPVVFPVHPRTRKNLAARNSGPLPPGLILLEPLGYLEFVGLESRASLVITDSGGVQEETTFLGIPCLTVRPNTERPVTITQGTNRLVNPEIEPLAELARSAIRAGPRKSPCPIEGWDGRTGQRIAELLYSLTSG